ncbi:MAG: ADP-ribosyltransferase [Ignavibacteriaceae bacterium]
MENEIEFLEPFSQEEKDVIYQYKTAEDEFAYQLNAYLRGNIVHSPPNPVWIRHLDSAIKKCQTTKEITLYRATCSEDFDRFIRNNIFVDPAFVSTSLNENSLSTFFNSMDSKNPIKLVISCPPGANLISRH